MILTIGPGGCGFSFLNWSLTWLRGDTVYCDLQNVEHLVGNNPLITDGHTAHAYSKDHVVFNNAASMLKLGHDRSIIYVVPADVQEFYYVAQFPGKKIIFYPGRYHREIFLRQLSSTPYPTEIAEFEQFLTAKYPAVTVRSCLLDLSRQFVDYYPNYSAPDVVHVSAQDMFQDLDTVIVKLCDFLGFEIQQSRWAHWNNVYQQWQTSNEKFFNLSETEPVDRTVQNQILREYLLWKNGTHPHINRNLQAVV